MNKRIQRKRTRGWRTPENCIYVGRPTKWGNPFPLSNYTLEESLKRYRSWLENKLKENPHFLDELKNKDICCWCTLDQKCHGDIILEFQNKDNHKMDEFNDNKT